MRYRRRLRRQASVSQVSTTHDRWLVSYADFMTLLFAFFVVLFATSRHNNQALERLAKAIHSGFSNLGALPTAAAPPPPANARPRNGAAQLFPGADDPEMAALGQQLKSVLGNSIATGEIAVQQTPDGLVISLRELGFFNSGEAVLLPGAAEKVERVGAILMRHGLTLRVEGHSDDQPIHNASFRSNWELSAARAMTVLLLLVDDAHYDPTRLSMGGYGPYRPVASNATPEGRRLNRRVDLVVVSSPANRSPRIAPGSISHENSAAPF